VIGSSGGVSGIAMPSQTHFNNHSSGNQTPGDRSAAYSGGTGVYLSEIIVFQDSVYISATLPRPGFWREIEEI
jgi:hypothetical protein